MALVMVAASSACVTGTECDPARCATGCCDAAGLCQVGDLLSSCGSGGNLCVVCESTQVCRSGSRTCGTNQKPNVFLVVDTSETMGKPVDADRSTCPLNCMNSACPQDCPTRKSTLTYGASSALSQLQDWRFGLAMFPSTSGQCLAPGGLDISPPANRSDDPNQLSDVAYSIYQAIQGRTPAGGSPTTSALELITTLAADQVQGDVRSSVVLLITDALPTCAPGDPNRDDLGAAVAVVRKLRVEQHIRTAVVALGDDANQVARSGLESLATEGGFTHPCATDAECGIRGHCEVNGGQCTRLLYSAFTSTELADIIVEVARTADY